MIVDEIKRAIMDATGEFNSDDVFAAMGELMMMVLCDWATDGGKRKASANHLAAMYREMAEELEARNGPLN